MTKIAFGTDGWRAVIAREFTTENVARVTHGVCQWLRKQNSGDISIIIGHDCRFGGPLFVEYAAKVFLANGIKVYMAEGFVSTPMISLGIIKLKADMGIVITASHNPPEYNGYKLKGGYGGPLLEKETKEVESLIPETQDYNLEEIRIADFIEKGLLIKPDLETIYYDHVVNHFDIEAIKNSGIEFAFDAMYGAGQNIMRRLFPDIALMHCEHNPLFDGIPPEPLHKNLLEFSEMIRLSGDIDCGLAVDGDADRIALYDGEGNYVDSHHVILLLIHYLHKYKGMKGKVCTGTSSTVKINTLCAHYNIPLDIVKIGFKHIAGTMLKETVLVGGEESGGIAVDGHIPERDGIWNGLVIWEFMAQTGKNLRELINEVYEITGSFAFERSDLRLEEAKKNAISDACKAGYFKSFGPYQVERVENIDGYKYFFNDHEWLMIRPSGTEPLLRTYAESSTREKALEILKIGYDTIMKIS
ncbi:MAG: phosphoglucomutase/phosphomannomutase family protein [Bacteroidetes bacterium]|nr:phosphoglucomutase/phosphomannomutase family protein [Bacteroidota bacterium]